MWGVTPRAARRRVARGSVGVSERARGFVLEWHRCCGRRVARNQQSRGRREGKKPQRRLTLLRSACAGLPASGEQAVAGVSASSFVARGRGQRWRRLRVFVLVRSGSRSVAEVVLRSSAGQALRAVRRAGLKAKGVGVAAERRHGPVRKGRVAVESVERGFCATAAPSQRATVLMAAWLSHGPFRVKGKARARAKVGCCVSGFGRERGTRTRAGGSENSEATSVSLQRGNDSSIGRDVGVTRRARTDSQEDQGFEVDEAGGTSGYGSSRVRTTGKQFGSALNGAVAVCGKGVHSRRGNLANAPQ